jgi:hypothetical protein
MTYSLSIAAKIVGLCKVLNNQYRAFKKENIKTSSNLFIIQVVELLKYVDHCFGQFIIMSWR